MFYKAYKTIIYKYIKTHWFFRLLILFDTVQTLSNQYLRHTRQISLNVHIRDFV